MSDRRHRAGRNRNGPGGAPPPVSRPQRRPPPLVSKFTSKIAKPIYQRFGFTEPHIFQHWSDIVGAELARRAAPQRLSRRERGRDAAVLTVRVDGASGLELQHLAPQVIERINIYYGYRAVSQLKFVQAPLRHEPQRQAPEGGAPAAHDEGAPDEDLSGIPDGPLKNALDRLGRNVRARASRRSKGL